MTENTAEISPQRAESTGFGSYRAMLRDYERAAEKLRSREQILRQQLRQCRRDKSGCMGAARRMTELERRLTVLLEEYYDLLDIIRSIRPYAEKEVFA